MKKLIIISTLFVLTFSSCQQDPSDIKISDLKTACDVIDAANLTIDEIEKFKKEHSDVYDYLYEAKIDTSSVADTAGQASKRTAEDEFKTAHSADIKRIEELKEKMKDLKAKADRSFTQAEAKECLSEEAFEKFVERANRY